jgi:hypothetical protein
MDGWMDGVIDETHNLGHKLTKIKKKRKTKEKRKKKQKTKKKKNMKHYLSGFPRTYHDYSHIT